MEVEIKIYKKHVNVANKHSESIIDAIKTMPKQCIGSFVRNITWKGKRGDVNTQVESSCIIIDITLPRYEKIYKKQTEKAEKYQDLKMEVERLWDLKNIQIVSAVGVIVIGVGSW